MTTKCLIIGSGPAGYTAAIYAARAGLSPIVYTGNQPGGQLTITTEIENFPGYPEGVSGDEMMGDLAKQARRFGANVADGSVVSVDTSKRPFLVKTDSGEEITAETIIIATGASAKLLGLEDEKRLWGMGVSACATCDGFFYRKKVVAVVGGGDTACEEALYLSNLASKVYMIVRKGYLRASNIMRNRIVEKENIEVLFNSNTIGLVGDEYVEAAKICENAGDANERTYKLPIDGFFLAIGHKPNTDFLKGQIELDSAGYIVTKQGSTATNVEGIFAAGDVADPVYRQAISAADTGCRAALDAERFLNSLEK